jgi:hypothetical protein
MLTPPASRPSANTRAVEIFHAALIVLWESQAQFQSALERYRWRGHAVMSEIELCLLC